MRLIFKLGLVRDRPTPLAVQAAADTPESPVGRWISANLDLKTVVSEIAFVTGLIATHTATSNRLTVLEQQNTSLREKVDTADTRITAINRRLSTETVAISTYDRDTRQLDLTLGNLSAGQQQIYNLLITRPATAPR